MALRRDPAPVGSLASRREVDGALSVIAYLPEPLTRALQRATADRHRLTAVRSAVQFERALEARVFDLAFVDPCLSDELHASMLARYPRLAVVLYTRLSADTPRHAVRMAVRHLVLAGIDDEPGALARLIEAFASDPVADTLLAAIAPGLARVPAGLRVAIERLVRGSDDPRAIDILLGRTGCSRASLYRVLRNAGLPSPAALLRMTRVMRAIHYGYRHGHGYGNPGVAALARRLGYRDPRRFSAHFAALTGYPPSRLPLAMSPTALALRVMGRVGIEPTSVRL